MRRIKIILGLIAFASFGVFGQTDKAKALIDEGIRLHDQGKYSEAIEKYRESYKLDSSNVVVYCELGLTYFSLKDFTNTENICKRAIERFPGDKALKNIYSTYCNSLDESKRPAEALKVYEEGISKYPGYYMLHFNKGITEYGLKNFYEARTSLQKAITLNPRHASSYFYLGIIEDNFQNRIPAVLTLSYFMLLSPEGQRAAQILPYLTKKTNNLYYQEKNGASISTMSSAKDRTDTTAYDFGEIEKGLGLISIFSTIMPDNKKSEMEKFESNLQSISELLNVEKKKHSGFYWDKIAPFFIDLALEKQAKGFVLYINAYENTDKDAQKVIDKEKKVLDNFIKWYKN
jgi:tetratricopeptide (TPR) repeat protein